MTTGKRAERTKLDLRCPICRSATGQASCLICARLRQLTFSFCCLPIGSRFVLFFVLFFFGGGGRVGDKLSPATPPHPRLGRECLLLVSPFLCLYDLLSRPPSRFMFKRMFTKVPDTIVVRRGAHSVNHKTVRHEKPGRARFASLQLLIKGAKKRHTTA